MATLNLKNVKTRPHPTARDTAVAVRPLSAGETIVSVPAWTTALLISEKGRRCDWCGCLPLPGDPLLKCGGCGSYWYCGKKCQLRQWKAHHRSICKYYARYTASAAFQGLPDEEKVDAVLLSHTLANLHESPAEDPAREDDSSPYSVFQTLIEYTSVGYSVPPVCGKSTSISPSPEASSLYARFGNNNFVLHSHLTAFAHGIFPLTSRLFNHSCVPNAVVKYKLKEADLPCMEVVAIADVAEDEEITIPYLDPAIPLDVRQHQLQSRYGFKCNCVACTFQRKINPVPFPSPEDLKGLEAILRQRIQLTGVHSHALSSRYLLPQLPPDLFPLLHDSYLPSLSEAFSKTSHDGEYALALEAGLTLLGLYSMIYPRNYPLIGMHALELAKTAWNASIQGVPGKSEDARLKEARSYLVLSREVLGVLGPEGDPGGPMEEINTLTELLRADGPA
ncbi:hypothetical protein GLOTRDRAFT_42690 [Gloeophyllum trabeum ATCC 11539]|uniref:SET domain-containing protein n=1 Tax=Gloeophyllum trabeum (strain ATCC 11539 / FP-39264 / Madison 617) TaxID=670483 RepID=S7RP77_GLOTA|nr:uncharacterized protein GLOTRDRAFT_42690 [Gloeophyllum trabeum ATCC 11539]EPQ54614.1 hypothetical protein GLOTRDRAFT_42690 [Gloeophyllum trabeum ATCC 11539]